MFAPPKETLPYNSETAKFTAFLPLLPSVASVHSAWICDGAHQQVLVLVYVKRSWSEHLCVVAQVILACARDRALDMESVHPRIGNPAVRGDLCGAGFLWPIPCLVQENRWYSVAQ